MTHDFRMGVDDVRNALTRESLFTETALDVDQDLLMGRVRLVEDVLEREIRRAEAVTEMLGEDPAAVYSHVNKSNAKEPRRSAYAQA
jgi:hypothetical protein